MPRLSLVVSILIGLTTLSASAQINPSIARKMPGSVHRKTATFPATEDVVYSFGAPATNGTSPTAGLMQASDGNFYGTTPSGGTGSCAGYGCGTLFQISPNGTFTLVYTFCSQTGCSDGGSPTGTPVEASDGNLYGTTAYGGTGNNGSSGGTIYQYNLTTGLLATVYVEPYFFGSEVGGIAYGDLIDDGKGNLYGTVSNSGSNYYGSIISYNYLTNTFSTLYTLDAAGGTADGFNPLGGLVLASDGNLYGLTSQGGANNHGTAFELAVDGSGFTVIYSFGNTNMDGQNPQGELTEASDGNLYGFTSTGGSSGAGTFFQVMPFGASSTINFLYSFSGADGAQPLSGRPFLGGDANFYVAGYSGGSNGQGGVMQMTTAGGYADVFDFQSPQPFGPGAQPFEGTDGSLYGSTEAGGTSDDGAVYELLTALPPVITLTSSASSVSSGSPVTLTWAVSNAFSKNAEVCAAYSSDGSWTGSIATSGSASVTPTATGTVTYAITCGGVESATTSVTVTALLSSATTLSATPNPATLGAPVVLSASITGSGAAPTGTVKFIYNGNAVVTANVINGIATYTVNTKGYTAGTYLVSAMYSGDSSYSGSTSATLTVTLNSPAATTTTLQATPNPGTIGQVVTLTATVVEVSSASTPTGKVTFIDGTTVVGTTTLNSSGVATLASNTSTLPSGSYSVTAEYAGDSTNAPSNSSLLAIQLQKATTVTTLSVTPETVTPPALVTLSATVTRSAGEGTPAGKVAFYYGTRYLGTGTLNSSGATTLSYSSAGVPAGDYAITADYVGDSGDSGSTSAPVSVTVN